MWKPREWDKTKWKKARKRREILIFFLYQDQWELGWDWKFPVCLSCLHELMETDCSADNVTVLTSPPFSFCFNFSVKRQECGNVIPAHLTRTHSDKPRQTHAHIADSLKLVTLTHTDMFTESHFLCIILITHPNRSLCIHTFDCEHAESNRNVMTHTSG